MTDRSAVPPVKDRLVVIGCSAGGLTALIDLLRELPADFPAPIIVAAHGGPDARLLEALQLQRDVKLTLQNPVSGDRLTGQTVYVLPGATHGLIHGDRIELSGLVDGSGFRPSIDALFMTAAASWGHRTLAIVLSGTMTDGLRGAQVVYDLGGDTVVQDPDEAQESEMPRSVISRDHPRAVLSATDIGRWLTQLD